MDSFYVECMFNVFLKHYLIKLMTSSCTLIKFSIPIKVMGKMSFQITYLKKTLVTGTSNTFTFIIAFEE